MMRVRALRDLTRSEREALIRRAGPSLARALPTARRILDDVRRNGDAALRRWTLKLDGARLASLEVPPSEWRAAARRVPRPVRAALARAHTRIRRFHDAGRPQTVRLPAGDGAGLQRLVVPLARVGIYAPGGRAAYPSTVLMAGIPAALAGVGERILCTPPGRDGRVPDILVLAARMAGITRLFRLGGAQAIAALAFGTESVPAVDKIVGPGNAYVAAAKSLVRDVVGIDFMAGPSEVLVVSDGSASAAWLAAELIAQAEHDTDAVCVLVTTAPREADAVQAELRRQCAALPRRAIAGAALRANGRILTARTTAEALEFANAFGPEHLVLAVRHGRRALAAVRSAGSVFVGPHAPVALGDFCAGTNHILPTGGTARFASALAVDDFVKHIPVQAPTRAGLARLAPTACTLARAEGLEGHARAVEIALEGQGI